MHNWFLTKIRYEKVMENGIQKKVTEPYLVDALSFTEAEARIIEEVTPFISGEFTVSDISRAHYSEIFTSEEDSADKWFAGRLAFITLDEKSGAEKKTAAQMLTQASNLKEAIEVLEKGMKGTLADYEIASVTETALMDIFPYDAEDDKDTDKTADANNPSVRKFFQSLPEGCKTEITVSGKKIIVDKTGRDTVVTPSGEG